MKSYLSFLEVGKEIEMNYWFVRSEVLRGNLIAHKFGGRFYVSRADLDDYIRRCRKARPGLPKKQSPVRQKKEVASA